MCRGRSAPHLDSVCAVSRQRDRAHGFGLAAPTLGILNSSMLLDCVFHDQLINKQGIRTRSCSRRYLSQLGMLSAILAASIAPLEHLAIDPSSVSSSTGVEIALGPVVKDSANPLFGEDEAFDVAWWNTYPTVAHDAAAGKFKMWYNGCGDCGCVRGTLNCSVVAPFLPTSPTKLSNNGMCPHLGYNFSATAFGTGSPALTYYAESADGVHWIKPDLGIVEWKGDRVNNIVLSTDTDPNRGVFLDLVGSAHLNFHCDLSLPGHRMTLSYLLKTAVRGFYFYLHLRHNASFLFLFFS